MVIARRDSGGRFIGASIDAKAQTLTLLRGNLEAVVAPFALFPKSGDGTVPDFSWLRLTDYGCAIALGDCEVSAYAILYELDPAYRRQLKKQCRQSERTFGGSLMRLRKQRPLNWSDFAPISAKEIARIERNAAEHPRATTLESIANRLGIRPVALDISS